MDAKLAALQAENDALRDVLRFYADEWQPDADGDSSTPGIYRTWKEPTEELFNDAGRRARSALSRAAKAEGRP